jgi:hypothetical protein
MKLTLGLSFVLLAACAAGQSGEHLAAPAPTPTPGQRITIEESDIYRQSGAFLYVQNPQTGLNILDISDPGAPAFLGRSPVVGAAGELYLHAGYAVILFKSATPACRPLPGAAPSYLPLGGEVAFVDVSRPWHPTLTGRYCLAGTLVASRVVNDFLLLVTSQGTASLGAHALSVDIADPARPAVVSELDFPSVATEIQVTDTALFAAGWAGGALTSLDTEVQYIEISATQGSLRKRGSLIVRGQPQGRFHMDVWETTFRIVTYDTSASSSRLSILDVSNPDALRLLGTLTGIGYGERLYATRFDAEMAYVVSYRNTDPLWVLSLKDPTAPRVVGELQVPGWSDFLFPRGTELLAVGRGDRGYGVQVSLFDVSNPTRPTRLSALQVGDWSSTSEANVDFRAVAVLERAGMTPLVVVPFSQGSAGYGCGASQFLQLIDLGPQSLSPRGALEQNGIVRRSLLAGNMVLSISDFEVLALDVNNRDNPAVSGSVPVGDLESLGCRAGSAQPQAPVSMGAQPLAFEGRVENPGLCASVDGSPMLTPLVLLGLVLVIARRRAA